MGKVTLNPDEEIVKTIKEGLKAKDGYCPCRLARTPENKCICKEFKEQMADPATYQDAAKAAELAKQYQQKKDEIDSLYQAWEELESEE